MEKDFYIELLRRKEAGEFTEIILQPKLELQPKFKRDGKTVLPVTYTPDFLTIDQEGTKVYWDAKGISTQQGDLRRKLYLYRYPEELRWVTKSTKYAVDGNPWVSYDYLQKCRRDAKKAKKSKEESA